MGATFMGLKEAVTSFLKPGKGSEPLSFEQVLDHELKVVKELRKRIPKYKQEFQGKTSYQQAHDAELLGLAFSGGGIRSATFNLGVLQALAKLNTLHCFDYLSTVSGGDTSEAGWLLGRARSAVSKTSSSPWIQD